MRFLVLLLLCFALPRLLVHVSFSRPLLPLLCLRFVRSFVRSFFPPCTLLPGSISFLRFAGQPSHRLSRVDFENANTGRFGKGLAVKGVSEFLGVGLKVWTMGTVLEGREIAL